MKPNKRALSNSAAWACHAGKVASIAEQSNVAKRRSLVCWPEVFLPTGPRSRRDMSEGSPSVNPGMITIL